MSFAEAYRAAFRAYLRGSGEAALEIAYELGRRAIEEKMSVLDLAEIHHDTLADELSETGDREQLRAMAEASTSFFTESLSAFEMLQRGFQEVQQVALLEQQYAEQLRALADGSTALNGTFSVEEILRLMAELAPRIVGAEKGIVAIRGNGRMRIIGQTAWEPAISAELLAVFEGSVGRFQAPNGEEILVGSVSNGDDHHATIILAEKEAGGFSDRDEAVLAKLSQTCSVAIERAGLYERQRRIAETLQRALLPHGLPAVPGLEMAARYVPGGAGENVGGDWYDLVELSGRRVGLALGDVMGRGIRAAAVMGQVRMAFRAYAMEHEQPAHVLDRVARLISSLDPEHFSTLVYLVLDMETGIGSVSRAGHPPPMLVTAEGEASFLPAHDSPPLCSAELPDYRGTTFEIGPGDTLLLYTDGLLGRRQLEVGMDRMLAVAGHASGDVEQMCDLMLEQMPLDAEDDVAILAVRLTPP